MKKYVFEDGIAVFTKGMNRMELKIEEMHHGKLITIEKVY